MRYELTGALYEDSSTTIGSIVMCIENTSIGIKQIGDSCLQSAPTLIHLNRNQSETSSSTSSSSATAISTPPALCFLDRIRQYFEGKIAVFTRLLRKDILHFHPQVGIIHKENIALLRTIQQLNPYIISWSNVNDYMSPMDFHSCARMISNPDTVHYLHSCNWPTCIFGTDIYDINELARGGIYQDGIQMCQYAQSILSGFVHETPPIGHFRTFCQLPLIRKFLDHYLHYFFAGQEDVHMGLIGVSPFIVPNPFLRSDTTIHFVISYGNTVQFGENSYDSYKSINT